MAHKAWQQGHFDGLCGIYSLLNSIDHLHGRFNEDDCSKLFEFLIKAGGDQFPAAVYNGLDFGPLCDIARQIPAYMAPRSVITLSTPYVGTDVDSADAFFDDLAGHITGRHAVAVIGLGAPWDHWTVVSEVLPKSIRFVDSYGIKRFNRTKFSLTAGDDVIKLDFRETLIIERKV
jgi:hypothetical protein